MKIFPYDREAAVQYAAKWTYRRNPSFYDFSHIGGDCTNFASQCIYAGTDTMNLTPLYGWFYRSLDDRTPSWTGVEYLHQFLISNEAIGPFAEEVPLDKLQRGDIVQLGRATGDFYHSPVVTGFSKGSILVTAHSYDTFNKPLNSYTFERVRGIHILGYRK